MRKPRVGSLDRQEERDRVVETCICWIDRLVVSFAVLRRYSAHFWFETHTRSESVSIVHSCGNPSSPVGSTIVLNHQIRHRTFRTDLPLPSCNYLKHAMRVFHQLYLVERPVAHLTKTGPADPSSYSGCFITFLIWALIPTDQLEAKVLRRVSSPSKSLSLTVVILCTCLMWIYKSKIGRAQTFVHSPVTRGR
jgi:hypothetical protein